MRKYLKIVIPVGVILVLAVVLYPPYHRWAREHVNFITAAEDHPLKCTSCHFYLGKTEFVSADKSTLFSL
jgi:hypothetical protein